jgi:hypothetical protein
MTLFTLLSVTAFDAAPGCEPRVWCPANPLTISLGLPCNPARDCMIALSITYLQSY